MSQGRGTFREQMATVREPSGHVFRVERKRGLQWYAKYRLPDGRQVQKHLGPAWTERGRPLAGYLTKRTAEAALRELLDHARRGTLPGMVRTGATVNDACDEYLRWLLEDRGRNGRQSGTIARRSPSTCARTSRSSRPSGWRVRGRGRNTRTYGSRRR